MLPSEPFFAKNGMRVVNIPKQTRNSTKNTVKGKVS